MKTKVNILVDEDKKSLRVVIDGKHLRMFNKIKQDRKFKYDSEVIRFCLVEASGNTEFRLDTGYWEKIRELLRYDFVKLNHHIYDTQDFVNRALEEFIMKIESNIKSLMAFEARQMLEGKELETAISFIKCQEASPAEQVDLETLAKEMNKRNIKELESILESFVKRGLLTKKRTQDKNYYHARPVELGD